MQDTFRDTCAASKGNTETKSLMIRRTLGRPDRVVWGTATAPRVVGNQVQWPLPNCLQIVELRGWSSFRNLLGYSLALIDFCTLCAGSMSCSSTI